MSKDAVELLGKLATAKKSYTTGRKRILGLCALTGVTALKATPGYPHGNVALKKLPEPRVLVGEDQAKIKVAQAARLVNDDTRAHFIVPRKGRGSRKNRQRAAAFLSAFGATGTATGGGAVAYGNTVRAWFRHPGTRGKHFMEAGRETAAPLIAQTYDRAQHAELARIFTGG